MSLYGHALDLICTEGREISTSACGDFYVRRSRGKLKECIYLASGRGKLNPGDPQILDKEDGHEAALAGKSAGFDRISVDQDAVFLEAHPGDDK